MVSTKTLLVGMVKIFPIKSIGKLYSVDCATSVPCFQVDSPKCLTTDDSKSPSSASKLGLKNLGGIFVFLIGGLGLALIIAIIEFIVNATVNSKTDKVSIEYISLKVCLQFMTIYYS